MSLPTKGACQPTKKTVGMVSRASPWLPVPRFSFPVPHGNGMCVAFRHGLCICTDYDGTGLSMYSLSDGRLVRTATIPHMNVHMPCMTPDETRIVLIESHVDQCLCVGVSDWSFPGFERRRVLIDGYADHELCAVDCNAAVVVVADCAHFLTVLSWVDARVLARFGGYGTGVGKFKNVLSLKLLADGTGVLVPDLHNHRLCVFTLDGTCVATYKHETLMWPSAVVECAGAQDTLLQVTTVTNKT
jgi:hypothetical protein